MIHLRHLLVFAVCFSEITSMRWTSTVTDGQVMYACTGQNVTIPWSFDLVQGEVIDSMQWLYRGVSQEIVAMYSHGTFVPLPAFGERVQNVGNGGLQLFEVTPGDSGNYSIDLTTTDATGEFSTNFESVILVVTDGLLTTDGQLHVTQKPDVIKDPSTQQWSMVLTCGNFTSVDRPPFPVEWVTPSGEIMASSAFGNGHFELHLGDPVFDGNYVCRVPQAYRTDACLQGSTNPAAQAEVGVDGVTTTMVLVAAELRDLKRTNYELTNLTRTQQSIIDQLESELEAQQNMIDILFQVADPCNPITYTVIDDSKRDVSFGDGSGCDSNLTMGWYRFQLDGANAVMPTTCVGLNHCNTEDPIWLDLQGQALPTAGQQIEGRGCSHVSGDCCQTSSPLIVHGCNGFYVYNLRAVGECNNAYCVLSA